MEHNTKRPFIMGEVCAACKFNSPVKGTEAIKCRRYPPQMSTFLIGIEELPDGTKKPQFQHTVLHPQVEPGGWCGEWKPIILKG